MRNIDIKTLTIDNLRFCLFLLDFFILFLRTFRNNQLMAALMNNASAHYKREILSIGNLHTLKREKMKEKLK